MSEIQPLTHVVAGAYNVSKHVGGQAIVRDVSLEVPKGEIVLLSGESGSGKSTVMRMIAGIDTPSAGGDVQLFGRSLSRMSRSEKTQLIANRVGVGFQAPNLDTNLTVLENFIGLTEARGQRPDFDVAARMIGRLGLRDKLYEKSAYLSGGEKLKLALGRVMLAKPELLLLDEPTYALDHKNKDFMFEDIATACRELGTSALIVTHDTDAARSIANREFVMDSGRLVEEIVYDGPTGRRHMPLSA